MSSNDSWFYILMALIFGSMAKDKAETDRIVAEQNNWREREHWKGGGR